MTYRELLEKCKTNSGCLSTREQKEIDSRIKYQLWMARLNRENQDNKK